MKVISEEKAKTWSKKKLIKKLMRMQAHLAEYHVIAVRSRHELSELDKQYQTLAGEYRDLIGPNKATAKSQVEIMPLGGGGR